MKRHQIYNLTVSAMLLALGLVLPFLTGQIPQIGKMLLPMHISVLLCGLICGAKYGLAVGAITPVLRSAIFGMPVMYPAAVAMLFELAAYGFISGLLYSLSKKKTLFTLYCSMLAAMLAGRIVWGIAQIILLGIGEGGFTFGAFIAGGFTTALPGIILQLILIPAVMLALKKTRIKAEV